MAAASTIQFKQKWIPTDKDEELFSFCRKNDRKKRIDLGDLALRLLVHDQVRDRDVTDLRIRSIVFFEIGLHFSNLL